MIKPADLPEVLSVFPLPGALLLPRANLPLHIFEPRYLVMLEHALQTPERLIGMVQPSKSGGEGLYSIGCAGRITQFSETGDGRYMITLTGISRYRIEQEVEGFEPYRRARISWEGFARDLAGADRDAGFDRAGFLDLLARYFADQSIETDWDSLKEAEDEMLINSLSVLLGFEPEDKQALLEAPTLTDRRETLVALLEYSLHSGGEETMQ